MITLAPSMRVPPVYSTVPLAVVVATERNLQMIDPDEYIPMRAYQWLDRSLFDPAKPVTLS
jgi:hypothetical protein